MSNNIMDLDFDFGQDKAFQESYDAGHSSYSDPFSGKFNSFNPETIISGGNNKLKSGLNDMDIEESDLAYGYKRNDTPLTPKTPGRFS